MDADMLELLGNTLREAVRHQPEEVCRLCLLIPEFDGSSDLLAINEVLPDGWLLSHLGNAIAGSHTLEIIRDQ